MEMLLMALLLGVKHSFDADHLLAVSNLLSKPRSLGGVVRLTANWTLGHIGGAIFVTILLFMFKDSLLPFIFESFELVVALMLIGFGILGLIQSRYTHSHTHIHDDESHAHAHIHLKGEGEDHAHKHIFGIGLVQGLASNDELLLLLTVFLGLASLVDMMVGVVLFSIGVFIGMIIFSVILNLKGNSLELNRAINGIVGIISIIYGSMMLFGL